MINSIALLAALVILSAEAQQSVSTSLLLPSGLFYPGPPLQPPTFVGQVTVTESTTYYTLGCNGPTSFLPGFCADSSYTFSEILSNTRYIVATIENFTSTLVESALVTGTGAASTYTKTYEEEESEKQTWTITCSPSPFAKSSTAICTSSYTDDEGEIESYSNVTTESSLYPVIFTVAAGYSAASGTSATPSPSPSAPTPKPTITSTAATAHPPLNPSSKVGIGLGIPLGACALAGVALLLYRHGKHKERSRMSQMGNLAPARGFVSESDAKKLSEAGAAEQVLGRQPPVYSMEMQG